MPIERPESPDEVLTRIVNEEDALERSPEYQDAENAPILKGWQKKQHDSEIDTGHAFSGPLEFQRYHSHLAEGEGDLPADPRGIFRRGEIIDGQVFMGVNEHNEGVLRRVSNDGSLEEGVAPMEALYEAYDQSQTQEIGELVNANEIETSHNPATREPGEEIKEVSAMETPNDVDPTATEFSQENQADASEAPDEEYYRLEREITKAKSIIGDPKTEPARKKYTEGYLPQAEKRLAELQRYFAEREIETRAAKNKERPLSLAARIVAGESMENIPEALIKKTLAKDPDNAKLRSIIESELIRRTQKTDTLDDKAAVPKEQSFLDRVNEYGKDVPPHVAWNVLDQKNASPKERKWAEATIQERRKKGEMDEEFAANEELIGQLRTAGLYKEGKIYSKKHAENILADRKERVQSARAPQMTLNEQKANWENEGGAIAQKEFATPNITIEKPARPERKSSTIERILESIDNGSVDTIPTEILNRYAKVPRVAEILDKRMAKETTKNAPVPPRVRFTEDDVDAANADKNMSVSETEDEMNAVYLRNKKQELRTFDDKKLEGRLTHNNPMIRKFAAEEIARRKKSAEASTDTLDEVGGQWQSWIDRNMDETKPSPQNEQMSNEDKDTTQTSQERTEKEPEKTTMNEDGVEAPVTPEEKALELSVTQEVEAMSPDEREKAGWNLQNFGFKIEKEKSKIFGSVYGAIAERLDHKGTGGRFFAALKSQFDERQSQMDIQVKQIAERKKEGKSSGFFSKFQNAGYFTGNILKYGRIATDIGGWTVMAPLRGLMLGSTIAASGLEAAKDARLENDEVKEKSRMVDIEKASEEAWKIYERAMQKQGLDPTTAEHGGVSSDVLKKAYREELPKDILARIEKSLDTGTGASLVQKVFEKHISWAAERMQGKLEAIDSDQKLSQKEKETKKEALLMRFGRSKMLNDFDRMVSQQGFIDTAAMSARYGSQAARAVVYGMMGQSVKLLWDNFAEAFASGSSEGPGGRLNELWDKALVSSGSGHGTSSVYDAEMAHINEQLAHEGGAGGGVAEQLAGGNSGGAVGEVLPSAPVPGMHESVISDYEVKAGDSLTKIMKEHVFALKSGSLLGSRLTPHGVDNVIENFLKQLSPEEMKELGIADPDKIEIGQTISISKLNELLLSHKVGNEGLFEHAERLFGQNATSTSSENGIASAVDSEAVAVQHANATDDPLGTFIKERGFVDDAPAPASSGAHTAGALTQPEAVGGRAEIPPLPRTFSSEIFMKTNGWVKGGMVAPEQFTAGLRSLMGMSQHEFLPHEIAALRDLGYPKTFTGLEADRAVEGARFELLRELYRSHAPLKQEIIAGIYQRFGLHDGIPPQPTSRDAIPMERLVDQEGVHSPSEVPSPRQQAPVDNTPRQVDPFASRMNESPLPPSDPRVQELMTRYGGQHESLRMRYDQAAMNENFAHEQRLANIESSHAVRESYQQSYDAQRGTNVIANALRGNRYAGQQAVRNIIASGQQHAQTEIAFQNQIAQENLRHEQQLANISRNLARDEQNLEYQRAQEMIRLKIRRP